MSSHSIMITGGRSPIALSIAKRLAKHSRIVLLTRDFNSFPIGIFDSSHNVTVSELDLLADSCISRFTNLLTEYRIEMICFAHRLSPVYYSPQERFVGEVLRVNDIIEEFVKWESQREKRIVVLSSPASKSVLEDQDSIYHATKASLSALVRYFAVVYGPRNFAINSVAPGSFIAKERSKKYYLDNPVLFQNIIDAIPSRKFTSLEDVSTYVEFLFRHAPMTINGTELVIDSGLTLIEQSKFARKLT